MRDRFVTPGSHIFADVVFAGASLAALDYDNALQANRLSDPPSVHLYPESKERKIVDSWGIIGGASWQYQPILKFMAYCMRSGESPWWIPYDASGRMLPEGMIDSPFSAITIVTAAFGGGSTAFSFLLLGLFFISVLSPAFDPDAIPGRELSRGLYRLRRLLVERLLPRKLQFTSRPAVFLRSAAPSNAVRVPE